MSRCLLAAPNPPLLERTALWQDAVKAPLSTAASDSRQAAARFSFDAGQHRPEAPGRAARSGPLVTLQPRFLAYPNRASYSAPWRAVPERAERWWIRMATSTNFNLEYTTPMRQRGQLGPHKWIWSANETERKLRGG